VNSTGSRFMSNFTAAHLLAGLALACLIATPVAAQTKSGAKIVCWKDKSGKIVGCGDTVPPEYRDAGTRELDTRGVTRKTTESAAEEARRKAQQEQAQKAGDPKFADPKQLAEQKRQDAVLLSIYANEKEIDEKRDRDLKDIDMQLQQMQASLKVTTDRLEQAKKANNKEDVARSEASKTAIEKSIAAKEKEREAVREKYEAQKTRYRELKGGGQSAATPAPIPAAAPAAKK
jgi:hypothetical protein